MKHWLRRQRYLADFTLAALARRRVKNTGLIVIYSIIVFVLASAMMFSAALRNEAGTVLAKSPELIVQQLVMGRHEMISGSEIEKLAGIRGVASVKGRLWGYFYDSVNGANYTFMVPDDESYALQPGEAILGGGIGEARDFTWDTAPLFVTSLAGKMVKFNVRETFADDSALLTADLVLISEADFRSFFNLPPDVWTDIGVTIRNELEIATIVGKAQLVMPNARFVTRSDIERTYQRLFDWREGLMTALAAAGVLAFAIFAAEKASGLSAEEAREIGILKAIGWDTGDVIAMKLWEGGLISFGAFLAGTVFAYLHVFSFQAGLFEPILKGWAVIYPDFALAPHVDGLQLATLFAITVIPYTAATLVPIWRAATADPDQVMR
ncbi:ABC transporter permease [Phaeovulum sp.]|uniref:ABC transporter permease n=1 Tax=Phaeovulum sp. TaxID=2934796 RepID=UPI0035675C70